MVPQNMTRALRLFAPRVADKLCANPGYQKPFKLMDVSGRRHENVDVSQTRSPCGLPEEPRSIGAHWHTVQRELLNELPDNVAVRINTQFISLGDGDDEDGYTTVHCVEGRMRKNPYAHWGNDAAAASSAHGGEIYERDEMEDEKEPKSLTFRARIVVGADGINSRVRGEMCRKLGGDSLAAKARAKYWGYSSVKAAGHPPDHVSKDAEEVVRRYLADGSRMCVIGSRVERACTADAPHVMLVHCKGEDAIKWGFTWKIIVQCFLPEPVARRLPEAGGHKKLVELVEKRLTQADFPDELVRFVVGMLSEESEQRQIIVRPTYMVPICKLPDHRLPSTSDPQLNTFTAPFGDRRVILAGDALHGTPPFHAQGMAMGMEDAVELVDAMATVLKWDSSTGDADRTPSVKTLEAVRDKYWDARFPRLKRAQRDTLKRLWSWDQDAYADLENYLLNFTPKAQGWKVMQPANS